VGGGIKVKEGKKEISPDTENSIYYARDNSQYVITSAPDMGVLKGLGIIKDARVHKVFTFKMGGPVLLRVGSREIAIGKDIAKKIMVGGK